jgi:hypothetical protein
MTSCVVPISVWKGWNSVLQRWSSNLRHKGNCFKPFWIDYHRLRENHLQFHMRNSSERISRLAEDVKLSAHGRHPTTYPFSFFLSLFILFCFCFLFLFSFVTLVFCFPGTSVFEFKFGGTALIQTYSKQFHPSPG